MASLWRRDSVWLGTEHDTGQDRPVRLYSAQTKIYRRRKRATWNYVNLLFRRCGGEVDEFQEADLLKQL